MIEILSYLAAAILVIDVAAIEESRKKFIPLHFVDPFIAPPDGKCAPQLKECDPDYIFYTDDGSCNNLEYSYFGQAVYPFERWFPANYSDGIDQPRVSVTGNPLPNSRRLRTALLPNAEYRDSEHNALFYAFGQYSSHDPSEHRPLVTEDKCCDDNGKPVDPMPYECLPTIMPEDDAFYSQFGVTCVDAKRSTNTKSMGCNLRPVWQINLETAYLDLSILYGSSADRAAATRAFKRGLLRAENDNDNSFQEYPIRREGPEDCPYGGLGENAAPEAKGCFFSGDDRTNQNPEIFSMNIVFFRCHNFVARLLHRINRHWDDQLLYLYARRITVAMYQNVFFSEYIHALIGCDAALKYNLSTLAFGYNYGYNPHISPQTFHEYTTTVGRSGHSTIRGSFIYGTQFRRPLAYRLRDKYFKLDFFLKKNVFLNIIQTFAFDQCSEQDKFLTEEVNNFLFPVPEMTYGGDLSALGIDRGREFGIQAYNSYRKLCGIPALNSFEDLADDIVYPEDIQTLKSLYESHEDIDLYIAGFMEKPYPGSMVGPTFTCLLGAQFQQWKYADQKYFEFPSAKFTEDQLEVIRSTTFARIICIANPEMEWIPKNAFYIQSDRNPAVRCSELLEQINLTPWQEYYDDK